MKIKDINYTILTVSNLENSMRFYHEVFDLPIVNMDEHQLIVQIGQQKIILVTPITAAKNEVVNPTPGSGSISLMVKDSLDYVINHLTNYGVEVAFGPCEIKGSNGIMKAVSVYDPDYNLIQLCATK